MNPRTDNHKTNPILDRLNPKTMSAVMNKIRFNPSPECWEWGGSTDADGYGKYSRMKAHRIMWTWAHNQDIPAGLSLDHLCRNRLCVNPTHLEPVTWGENVLRGVGFAAVNAKKTECDRGHPLNGPNLLIQGDGRRRCRICTAEKVKARGVKFKERSRA